MFTTWIRKIDRLLRTSLTTALFVYRKLISPLLGPHCRFYPSCSCYALQALKEYSIFIALRLVILRVLKCHPLHAGGYDPLPPIDKRDSYERLG